METIHLYNLSNLCRVCLSQTSEMSDIFDPSKGLNDIFTSIVDFELEKNEIFPNYLCTNCEEKVIICYEFIKQCKKTNDMLNSYKESDYKIDEDTKVSFESLPVTEIIEFISNDDKSDFQEDKEVKTRKLRLKQYPHEEVLKAIQEFKARFNEVKNCVKCKFQGRNSRALGTHMTFFHKELKGRWCSYCNKEFDDLNEHVIGHKKSENICKFCGKNMTGPGRLLEHLRSHTVIRPHKCDLCEMTFVSSGHLRIHLRRHTNEKPYNCTFCKRSFSQSVLLKTHLKRYHKKDDNFYCEDCKKSFESAENLRDHTCGDYESLGKIPGIPQQFQIKQNYCTICCKKVRSLKIHNKSHHESADFSTRVAENLCTVCGKQFKNRSHLGVHMRTHTGETPYSCSYCDRKMARRNHLVMHERTHTGDKPHVCTICKKAFSQTSILNTHMKLHTGRPEMCMICGKRFCRPAELKLHMRKHTGEKPFVCSYCGKSFVQKSHLVEHTRRHLDEKPFRCATCLKTFTQRSSLKIHMQIHTGEKPYKCSQCPYACRQSYSLTVHMKQHTDDAPRADKPHSCTYCHKTYTTLAMLNSHINSVHFNE